MTSRPSPEGEASIHQFVSAKGSGNDDDASKLRILTEIVKMLPTAVTVQDEHGEFLLVNDAAAAQFMTDAQDFPSGSSRTTQTTAALDKRRIDGIELLRTGHGILAEELVADSGGDRIFLTAHKPVRLADRNLLLSSSADLSEQKALQDALFRRAYYDELTDLPNRRVIEKRVTDNIRLREGGKFALAFLDIDNFKYINDYYGHATGDALLVEFARRLGLDLRGSDMLSRISGDEFLLLLDPVQSEDEIADYIHFLLQRLKAPFFVDGSELFASASIGISLYPDHGSSYDALRHNADIAMYRVKNSGKSAASIFDTGMEREAQERMEIEQSLRQAILEKRFCCAFQPKVDIRTREVKGIEALVRLRNDQGVIQAPGTFVNLAVELGLIDELTHLVLAEIMKSIDSINETFGPKANISINVAAKQAGNHEFMLSFAKAIEATGCPTRFIIELTEDAFLTKDHFQSEILPLFRNLGVGVSIDDFGIGYSSLSALADITADEIKIDRSFITDIHKRPRSQGILKAIESLSEALGMTVIAEGIETFEELAYLQAATKIRYAQGYYFSKPIFLEELKPASRSFSDVRQGSASRPLQQNRTNDARASGRR